MSKFSLTAKIKIALPYIIVVVFNLLWIFVIDTVSILPIYSNLSLDKINDLSKTIVQTSGILIAFLGASGYFYLGKLGELLTSNLSGEINVTSSLEAVRAEVGSYRNFVTSLELLILARCKSCQKKTCEVMKEHIEFLTTEQSQSNELEKQYTEDVKTQLEQIEAASKLAKSMELIVIVPLIFAVVFLFFSMMGALFAYSTASPKTLLGCTDFLVMGVLYVLLTWVESYQTISDAREVYTLLIKSSSMLSLIRSKIASQKELVDLKYKWFEISCSGQAKTTTNSRSRKKRD
jgi:hypothetical protein